MGVIPSTTGKSPRTLSTAQFAGALLFCIACQIGVTGAAILQYPPYLDQHGALGFVGRLTLALGAYAIAIVLVASRRGESWTSIRMWSVLFGGAAALLEILDVAIEDGLPALAQVPGFAIAGMISLFLLWAAAAGFAVRRSHSVRTGVLTAVGSAAVCMLIAVPASLLLEFFVMPPSHAAVATWAEYRRSGWHDARAFAIANTLDSAFTHLSIAVVVAAFVGSIAATATRVWIHGSGARGSALPPVEQPPA